MIQRSGILAGGNFIIDQVKIIDRWPEQDSLAHIIEHTRNNGGGPYNVLKDLSRMDVGYPLGAVALLGKDDAGEYIRDDLEKHCIDTRHVQFTEDAATSITDVMTVQEGGRRTFFHHKGSNSLLNKHHFNFSNTSYSIFYLGYLMLLDQLDAIKASRISGFAEVLKTAKESGLITIADAVSVDNELFKALCKSCMPFLDYLVLNEFEAEQITGIPLTAEETPPVVSLREAANTLLSWGETKAVYIHFPKGAYALNRENSEYLQPAVNMPAERIVGAVGAGDAFCAGLLHGIHEGMELDKQLRMACLTAASSLLAATASDGVLPLSESQGLAEAHGFVVI